MLWEQSCLSRNPLFPNYRILIELFFTFIGLDAIAKTGYIWKGWAECELIYGCLALACERIDNILIACAEIVAGSPDRLIGQGLGHADQYATNSQHHHGILIKNHNKKN